MKDYNPNQYYTIQQFENLLGIKKIQELKDNNEQKEIKELIGSVYTNVSYKHAYCIFRKDFINSKGQIIPRKILFASYSYDEVKDFSSLIAQKKINLKYPIYQCRVTKIEKNDKMIYKVDFETAKVV